MSYKIALIALATVMATSTLLTSCAPSRIEADNRKKSDSAASPITPLDDTDLPTTVEPELVSTSDDYEQLTEEKATEYQKQPEIIQNGEDKVYVGYSRLQNVKSTYNRDTLELEVFGTAEVLKADRKTVQKSQGFHLKGKYKYKTGKISLKPVETVVSQDIGLKVRAEVICLKTESSAKYNCDKAIIDVFIKDGENFYTEQLEATSLDRPTMVGGKTKKPRPSAPAVKPTVPPADNTPVQNNHESDEVAPIEPQKEEQVTVEPTPVAPTKSEEQATVITDNAKDEAEESEAEGEDGSINDRFVGQAPTADLKKLFSDEPEAEAKSDDQDEDQTEVEQIITEVAGRLILRDQVAGNGAPEDGRLRNASYLKTHVDSYKLADKVVLAGSKIQNYYGTQEMMDILEAVGKKMQSIQNNKIYVSRISARNGGPLPPSVSHQIGMDVDLGYPTNGGKIPFPKVAAGGSLRGSDYSAAKTLELFKFLMTQQVTPVDRIFADQSIINNLCREARSTGKSADRAVYAKLFDNIQHVSGHGDHFHLRLRCTKNQPGCRLKKYKNMHNCSI